MLQPIPIQARRRALNQDRKLQQGSARMKAAGPTPSPRTDHPDCLNAPRRRWLVTGLVLPLLALAGSRGLPRGAHAADLSLPAMASALNGAAMALFDAAETSDWVAAAAALGRAQNVTRAIGELDTAYVTSGGSREHFFEARNNLSADLIDAKSAISVQDRPWLMRAADELVTRAGELSEPFRRRDNTIVQRIETLLSLARRMRRARVSEDAGDLADASAAFRRLWSTVRGQLPGGTTPQTAALEQALAGIDTSSSSADLRKLYQAVAALRAAIA